MISKINQHQDWLALVQHNGPRHERVKEIV